MGYNVTLPRARHNCLADHDCTEEDIGVYSREQFVVNSKTAHLRMPMRLHIVYMAPGAHAGNFKYISYATMHLLDCHAEHQHTLPGPTLYKKKKQGRLWGSHSALGIEYMGKFYQSWNLENCMLIIQSSYFSLYGNWGSHSVTNCFRYLLILNI